MPFNEQPCFNCGRLPSEGHTERCIADYQEPAAEDDEPSSVPPGTGDTWSAPLRRPVQPKSEEVPPQLRSIAMLDLMRLECSYLNDRPVVFMDDLYRLAKPNIGNDRAYALRSEMCRLASWSRTPDEVAQALIAAVEADNALLEKAEGK